MPEPPWINVGDKNIPFVTDQLWAAFALKSPREAIYRHGGDVIRLIRTISGDLVAQPLTVDLMRFEVARAAHCYRITQKDEEKKLGYPPVDVAKDMLANSEPPVPILDRIVEVPIFGPDGSLQTEPGYHKGSRTFYVPADGLEIPPVPDKPSDTDVWHAWSFISDELLVDFPFVKPVDRAHALALFLLPFVRDMIKGITPLHLIEKPVPGTGASLLAKVMASVVEQVDTTPAATDDEIRKRIVAQFTGARTFIFIDNVTSLEGSALAAVLTAPYWADRILGASKMGRFEVRNIWMATGNNPKTKPEIARRLVRIHLVTDEPDPTKRTGFKHPDLESWAKEHRGELVWAALTLVRNWQAKGRPQGERVLASYESWSAVMGGILSAAGGTAFLANMDETKNVAVDEEEENDAEFIEAWWRSHGEAWVLARDLAGLVVETGSLPWMTSSISVGMKVSRLRDRVFAISIGKVRVALSPTRTGGKQSWRLVPVEDRH